MAISIDSTLKEILDCPEAVEVVEKYSPGFSKNPMLKMAYGMKLSVCVKFPQGGVKPTRCRSLPPTWRHWACKSKV